MVDMHDIVSFTSEGQKMLGVVIEHYSNPLDDFYVVYADYTLYRFHDSNEEASIIIENVIIPACDEAISEYKLKNQHLKDMSMLHKEMKTLLDALAKSADVESIFGDS